MASRDREPRYRRADQGGDGVRAIPVGDFSAASMMTSSWVVPTLGLATLVDNTLTNHAAEANQ
jgi:hypothetical protein